MKSLGTVTIIRGKGNAIMPIYNGIVDAELMRQKEIEQAEIERERKQYQREIKYRKEMCCKLSKDHIKLLKEKYEEKCEPKNNILKAGFSYMVLCMLILWERMGIVEYSYKKEMWVWKKKKSI